MTWAPLTREQFAALTEAQRAGRSNHWRAIVKQLRWDHYARYHAETDARVIEWRHSRLEAETLGWSKRGVA